MERLKNIKNSLISCVESQMGDLRNADAQELGEVIDMVKDMEEAIYYCTITKAMEENKEESKYRKHYEEYIPREVYYPSEWERDMEELEKYIQELSQDIVEMIKDATPEEKVMLQQKLSTLATKIQ